MTEEPKDKVFAEKQKPSDFQFDEKVSNVFDDMVERSVPFYGEMQRMAVELAGRFAKEGTNVYDLGSATGTTMIKLAEALKGRDVGIIGLDNSPSMIEKTNEKFKEAGCADQCILQLADLNKSVTLENASVAMLVLTLQFVRPLQREILIQQIADSLPIGGGLIVIEKILANDSLTNRMFIDFYYDYKKRRGYSEMEISQKREALENVLIPYRTDENIMLLRRNGFEIVETFFKWYNFAGFVAIKQ